MIFQAPFFQSWNTHCTTRALSAFRSTDLKYSSDARLTMTGDFWPSWRSFRYCAIELPQ